MNEFRARILTPLILPLAAAGFIGILVFSVSRILLAIPEQGSTIVALLLAAEILGVAAVLAAGSGLKPAQRGLLVLLGLALIGGGGVSASIGVRSIERLGVTIDISAKNVEFSTDTLTAPADTPFTIAFHNNDAGIPHNVAITTGQVGSPTIIDPDTIAGVASTAYKVPALPAGAYVFYCRIHPLMKGNLFIGEQPA